MKKLPTFLIVLFAALVTMGQLEKVTFFGSLSLYLHEVLLIGWSIYFLANSSRFIKIKQIKLKQKNLLPLILCAWILAGWTVAAAAKADLLNSFLYTLRLLLYLFSGWFFLIATQKDLKVRTTFLTAILCSGLGFLYFGFLQYFFIPDTRFLQFLGWDDHYYRLVSTLLDPAFTGILFILTFWLLQMIGQQKTVLKVDATATKIFSFLNVPISVLLTIGLALTYSRASYLAFGVSAVFVIFTFLRTKQKGLILVSIFCTCLLLASLPFLPRPDGEGVKLERTSTIISRTSTFQSGLAELHGYRWLIGKGLFTSNNSLTQANFSHTRLPDSWLMMMLQGTGVIGLGLFLATTVHTYLHTYKKNQWFWIGAVAVGIHGLFNASMMYVFVWIFLFALILTTSQTTQKTAR